MLGLQVSDQVGAPRKEALALAARHGASLQRPASVVSSDVGGEIPPSSKHLGRGVAWFSARMRCEIMYGGLAALERLRALEPGFALHHFADESKAGL